MHQPDMHASPPYRSMSLTAKLFDARDRHFRIGHTAMQR
jgi:hypothetical protein